MLAGCQFLPPGFLAAATGPITTKTVSAPLAGKVVDQGGRPVRDARVLIYPITNTSPITNASPLRVQALSAEGAAGIDLRTDADGAFTYTGDLAGDVNVEAYVGEDLKAWKGGLTLARGKSADAGTLTLAPPGRLTGKISVASALVTDRSGVVVYIPGSRYSAHTDAGGAFDLGAVPAGTFTVKAYSAELGRGEAAATIAAGTPADVPIAVSAPPPRITRVTLAGSDAVVGAAPIGGQLDLHGEHFGVAVGARNLVSFSGATGLAATPVSEGVLRVTVPADARSGNLRVLVGNLPSAEVSFRIATGLDLRFDALTLVSGGPCYDLSRVAQARDADGKAFAFADLAPFATWVAGTGGATTGTGRVTATAAGTFSVVVAAGTLSDRLEFTALGPTGAGDCRLAFPPGVSTLAGNGTQALVDGPGAAASFADPSGVWLSGDDVLVADTANHAIRRIDRDGLVSTVLGGTEGYDDGPAATARLKFPVGLALDGGGNLLIADTYSHRIRKFAGGTVSTLAGEAAGYGGGFKDGAGTAALLSRPSALAIAQDGTMYVADKDNHAIRKLTTAGAVTTLAGTASVGWADGKGAAARFAKPSGIAVDASGSIYVADRDNHCIRLILPGGEVTTVAGTASVPRSAGGALVGGYADGPAATAQFKSPSGLALGADGALYIADFGNKRIRKLAGGTVTTVAGSGADGSIGGPLLEAKFRGPIGLAVGPDGTIFVADSTDDRIRVVRP